MREREREKGREEKNHNIAREIRNEAKVVNLSKSDREARHMHVYAVYGHI